MLLIIDAELAAPPSEVTLFRDVTLFANCFLSQSIVVECRKKERDFYYKWLKDKCAWDFVEDIINPYTEDGISIRIKKGSIVIPRLSYYNYAKVINRLSKLT